MKPLANTTYVGKSSIHGKGLFAREDIPCGAIIGYLQGVACDTDGAHVLWLSETRGFRVSCNLRYINHADRPNACYYDDLSVVALHRIERYEEITHNYDSADW